VWLSKKVPVALLNDCTSNAFVIALTNNLHRLALVLVMLVFLRVGLSWLDSDERDLPLKNVLELK
jgi:hypothetical protein